VPAPRIDLVPRTPWVLRGFDWLPLPAAGVGGVLAALLFGVFLLYTTLFGSGFARLPGFAGTDHWIAEAIQDLFFGLTLAVAAASVRGAERDLEALRPALEPGVDLAAERGEVLRYRPLPLHLVALATGLFSAVATPLDPAVWADGRFPGWTDPTALWLAGRNFLNWWAVGFAMTLELMLGHRFSRLGDRLREPDLTDLAPLAPFGRRAQRNVSWWMLLAAFLSLNYAGRGWAGALLPLALVVLVTFASAAFVLPQLGARRRIRAAKAIERKRAAAAMREARAAAFAAEAAAPAGRLADAVAWEGRVAATREWPIEAPTLLRLGLFVALGLGSWVGAALVQELLARALG
jgi:hypothetical protein